MKQHFDRANEQFEKEAKRIIQEALNLKDDNILKLQDTNVESILEDYKSNFAENIETIKGDLKNLKLLIYKCQLNPENDQNMELIIKFIF